MRRIVIVIATVFSLASCSKKSNDTSVSIYRYERTNKVDTFNKGLCLSIMMTHMNQDLQSDCYEVLSIAREKGLDGYIVIDSTGGPSLHIFNPDSTNADKNFIRSLKITRILYN